MSNRSLTLKKADVARAMVNYHFSETNLQGAFDRLRSIQFDPLAPVGCNHDLVLQARVEDYKIGAWQNWAYSERFIYDGWDKQASLVPFSGWQSRKIYHFWHRAWLDQMQKESPHAVESVLREIETRGPLTPRELDFQERKREWEGSWYGPSVTKQCLRALWHAGKIMTHSRRAGQHVYDLTERVVPAQFLDCHEMSEVESIRALTSERHLALGIMRPTASAEIWSMRVPVQLKKDAMKALIAQGEIIPADVEGMAVHVSRKFVQALDSSAPEPVVRFIAPLDQFIWDRKLVGHLFGFDYVWEVYVPAHKRRFGYYVLPVLFGDRLVARVEFWCRNGTLHVRKWIWECEVAPVGFWTAFESALSRFMRYANSSELQVEDDVSIADREALLAAFRSQTS